MSVNIDFGQAGRGRPRKLLTPLAEWAQEVGEEIQNWMEAHNRNATGQTSNSLNVIIFAPSLVILDALSSIKYTLEGRGPGRKPPFDRILAWAQTSKGRSRASSAGMTVRQYAGAVWHNLGAHGTSAETQTLSDGDIRTMVDIIGGKHLEDLGNAQAEEMSDAMILTLTKSIPNTEVK